MMKSLFIFLLFLCQSLQGESNLRYNTYVHRAGVCSGTVILYDDHRFFREGGCGCDGASGISTGTWTMRRDTIVLSSSKLSEVVVVKNVHRARKEYAGRTHVRFLSIDGDTVDINLDPAFLQKSDIVAPIDQHLWDTSPNKKDYILDTAGATGVIEVRRLSVAFDSTVCVDTKGYNDITVVLNMPAICLWSSSFKYEENSVEKLFVKRGDTLLDVPVHDYGWKYGLETKK